MEKQSGTVAGAPAAEEGKGGIVKAMAAGLDAAWKEGIFSNDGTQRLARHNGAMMPYALCADCGGDVFRGDGVFLGNKIYCHRCADVVMLKGGTVC